MKLIRKSWSRRDFLKAAGFGTLAASMVNYMPALALDGAEVPKRVVFFTSPLGSRILEGWRPSLGHGDVITPGALGPILAPLGGYSSQMLLVEGLDIGPAYHGEGQVQAHGHNARSCLWTGAHLLPVDACSGGDVGFASGHSLDREIQLAWNLPLSRLHTIAIGPDPCIEARAAAYYEAPGSPQGGVSSLKTYFDSHWGPGRGAGGDGSRATAARLSMYAQIRERLKALRQQLPTRDHVRFDRHIASVDALHAELGAPQDSSCIAPPEPPEGGAVPKMQLGKEKHKEHVSQWFELVAAAIRCDAGRVFGVQYGYDGHTGEATGIVPSGISGNIHTWSHTANTDPVALQVMIEFNAYFAIELKKFMDQLAAIPEADGTTALDNTLIAWGVGMSDGDTHSSRNVPFVLLGGAKTELQMGRYFNFGGWPKSSKTAAHGGLPHNHLLVTILHALGIEADHFGSADIPAGDLDTALL